MDQNDFIEMETLESGEKRVSTHWLASCVENALNVASEPDVARNDVPNKYDYYIGLGQDAFAEIERRMEQSQPTIDANHKFVEAYALCKKAADLLFIYVPESQLTQQLIAQLESYADRFKIDGRKVK